MPTIKAAGCLKLGRLLLKRKGNAESDKAKGAQRFQNDAGDKESAIRGCVFVCSGLIRRIDGSEIRIRSRIPPGRIPFVNVCLHVSIHYCRRDQEACSDSHASNPNAQAREAQNLPAFAGSSGGALFLPCCARYVACTPARRLRRFHRGNVAAIFVTIAVPADHANPSIVPAAFSGA